jgi:hypothetical protein
MGWIAVLVGGACGPDVSVPGAEGTDSGSSTGSEGSESGPPTSEGTVDAGSSSTTTGGSAEEDTTAAPSSSESSSGGMLDTRCLCSEGEVCRGWESDLCIDTTFECVAIPDACADDLSCSNDECVEALCGSNGDCYDSCPDNPDEAFMCVSFANTCTPFEELCPAGRKCVFAAYDGWSIGECRLLPAEADAVGDPCTTDGDGYEDTCTADAICWNVDADTGVGRCEAYCEPGPSCPGVQVCVEIGTMPLCITPCDPRATDCAPGPSCVDVNGTFACMPEA